MIRKKLPVHTVIIYALVLTVIGLTIGLTLALREIRYLKSKIVIKETKEVAETVPTTTIQKAGIVSIIIDDFGYRNDKVSEGFLALDAELTYSVIPGHIHSKSFAEKAVKAGYEVIVHMPMETHFPTTGEEEFILTTGMTSAELEERMIEALAYLPQATGVSNHQGSRATEDERLMRVVGSVLKKHDKYFVDSRTSSQTIAKRIMREMGVPTNQRNVFLDNEFDPELIRKQLKQLVAVAHAKGSAIGIGHAKPTTLQVLQEQIPRLKKEGYQFKFVSAIVN